MGLHKLTRLTTKDQTQPNTWQTYYTMSMRTVKPVNITGGDEMHKVMLVTAHEVQQWRYVGEPGQWPAN